MNDISANDGAREMKFDSFDGGDDGGYNGVSLDEISEILVMQELVHGRHPLVDYSYGYMLYGKTMGEKDLCVWWDRSQSGL